MKYIICCLILRTSTIFASSYDSLVESNLIKKGEKPFLHLGCGESHLPNYINIDFPMSSRPLHTKQAADYFYDITKLNFPSRSISAIENHHVYEHFSRATSIALLCAWHYWLVEGGELLIETPDFENGIKRYLSTHSFETRQTIIRHLFGSQEASWALHWDGWSKDKFYFFLEKLGFSISSVDEYSWSCLDNIIVKAKKESSKSIEDLKKIGKELLKLSLVNTTESEMSMLQGWYEDFEAALGEMIAP